MKICEGVTLEAAHLYGEPWSVTESDFAERKEEIGRAAAAMARLRETGETLRGGTPALFTRLPYILEEGTLMAAEEIRAMEALAEECRGGFDAVVSVGIGGSYLGNRALFDTCCGPYWNMESAEERGGRPLCFFAGQTADPGQLAGLLTHLRKEARAKAAPFRVLCLVISKSGTTIEPSGALSVLRRELPRFSEARFAAITDARRGLLHDMAEENGWTRFTVPEGIGGRFSVFSQVGLVFGALLGIDLRAFLAGARAVEEACRGEDPMGNPALFLAAAKHIATQKYGITAEITMPYADRLQSFSWWYAQLLGESLGKKRDVAGRIVYSGRVPVSAVGTTDMHSLTQEHQEGKRNKLLQFITVAETETDLDFELTEDGKRCVVPMSRVTRAALYANAEALASEHRMSCCLSIARADAWHLGALMYFFMLAVSYEGAMANIDAYDQPGVEAYKKILHGEIRKNEELRMKN